MTDRPNLQEIIQRHQAQKRRLDNRKDSTVTTTTPTKTRLYRVTSTIDNWPHNGGRWDGVHVEWIPWDAQDRFTDQLPELLDPHIPGDMSESLIGDLLTIDEANTLKNYLKKRHDVDVTIEEVPLPISTRSPEGSTYIGNSVLPYGGSRDAYMLWEEDGYDLPIRIGGVYDVDGPDVKLVKVRACGHECKHHARVDEWIDPAGIPSTGVPLGRPPF